MPAPPTGSPGIVSPPVLGSLLAIFVPAALLTGAVVLVLYSQDRAAEESLHEQAGSHLVDLHANIITRELEALSTGSGVENEMARLRNEIAAGDGKKQIGPGAGA